MKRVLLVLYTAVLFLNLLAMPTAARADGDPGPCLGSVCKP
jgi:hypothetical protein